MAVQNLDPFKQRLRYVIFRHVRIRQQASVTCEAGNVLQFHAGLLQSVNEPDHLQIRVALCADARVLSVKSSGLRQHADFLVVPQRIRRNSGQSPSEVAIMRPPIKAPQVLLKLKALMFRIEARFGAFSAVRKMFIRNVEIMLMSRFRGKRSRLSGMFGMIES